MNYYQEQNYEKYIEIMFPLDKDLIEKYHIEAGNGEEKCTARTISDIKTTTNEDFKFYIITEGNEVIGFFGEEFNKKYINTIFVSPFYRNKEKMKEIWNLISSHFMKPFATSLYKKNSRCIDFYIKNGAKIKKEFISNNNDVVFLVFEV